MKDLVFFGLGLQGSKDWGFRASALRGQGGFEGLRLTICYSFS